MNTKVCTGCKSEKPITEFYRQRLGKFGVTSKCKPCHALANRAWQKLNPEKSRAKLNRWLHNNKQRVLANARNYYTKTRPSQVAKSIKWQRSNLSKKHQYDARWKKRNDAKIK